MNATFCRWHVPVMVRCRTGTSIWNWTKRDESRDSMLLSVSRFDALFSMASWTWLPHSFCFGCQVFLLLRMRNLNILLFLLGWVALQFWSLWFIHLKLNGVPCKVLLVTGLFSCPCGKMECHSSVCHKTMLVLRQNMHMFEIMLFGDLTLPLKYFSCAHCHPSVN